MPIVTDATIKSTLQTGDKPTQQQLANFVDSKAHVNDIMNVGNTPVLNGTAGRLLFQGSSNKLAQDSNLFFDTATDSLGVGVGGSVLAKIHTKTTGSLSTDLAAQFMNSGNTRLFTVNGDVTIDIGMNNPSFVSIMYFGRSTGHYTNSGRFSGLSSFYDGNYSMILTGNDKTMLRAGEDGTGNEAELTMWRSSAVGSPAPGGLSAVVSQAYYAANSYSAGSTSNGFTNYYDSGTSSNIFEINHTGLGKNRLGVNVSSPSANIHAKAPGNLSTDMVMKLDNGSGSTKFSLAGSGEAILNGYMAIGTTGFSTIGLNVYNPDGGIYVSAGGTGLTVSAQAANSKGVDVSHSVGGGTAIGYNATVNGSGVGFRYGYHANVSGGYTGSNIAFYALNGSLQLDNNDAIINNDARGLVLKSPNGHYWRLTIANDGSVTWTDLGTVINF